MERQNTSTFIQSKTHPQNHSTSAFRAPHTHLLTHTHTNALIHKGYFLLPPLAIMKLDLHLHKGTITLTLPLSHTLHEDPTGSQSKPPSDAPHPEMKLDRRTSYFSFSSLLFFFQEDPGENVLGITLAAMPGSATPDQTGSWPHATLAHTLFLLLLFPGGEGGFH